LHATKSGSDADAVERRLGGTHQLLLVHPSDERPEKQTPAVKAATFTAINQLALESVQ
jgi:hypothetical protein